MLQRVSEAPLDRLEFDRWRAEADRALHGARVQSEAGLDNWACFAAEQAAQLALKGLLHGLGLAPWGHDLVKLVEMCRQADLAMPSDLRDRMITLARHYIPARYPDAHASGTAGGHYGPRDSEQAIADAQAALAFVDATWDGFGD